MKKHLVYISLFIFMFSCEEVIEWDQKTEFTPRLVVEGFITNNPQLNYVKLTLPATVPGNKPMAVRNAELIVTDGMNHVVLVEDDNNPGYYYPEQEVRAVVNKIYTLIIQLDEYAFAAKTAMIPVGPQSEFTYREVQENFFIINPENGSDPSMTRYIIEWMEEGEYKKSVFYSYTLNSTDVNEFFKPPSESLIFPGNARVIRQKYSLSPGHQEYIRAMLSETVWKGGWFDVLPGNLPTNLSKGGVGYFAASSVLVDTVYFE